MPTQDDIPPTKKGDVIEASYLTQISSLLNQCKRELNELRTENAKRRALETFHFKRTSNSTDAGKAKGKAFYPGTVNLGQSGGVAETDLGDLAQTENVEIWDPSTVGAEVGRFVGTRPDGTYVALAMGGGGDTPVTVKVTAAAGGGGKYSGRFIVTPPSTVAATGDLALSDFGSLGGLCLVINSPEIGASTHSIDNDTVLEGFIQSGSASDAGLPVVKVNWRGKEDCAT